MMSKLPNKIVDLIINRFRSTGALTYKKNAFMTFQLDDEINKGTKGRASSTYH